MTTRKKHKVCFTVFICALVISIIVCGVNIYNSFWNIKYTALSYTENTSLLDNPYCGWYNLFGYELNDNEANYFDSTTANYIEHSPDTRIVLLEINLKNYSNGNISDAALLQADRIFTQWGKSGYDIILRFLYDWDGKASLTEPKSISIIKKHMEQTSVIVNKHTNDIFCMQGIFVGNYAEMHGSQFLTDEYIRELATHLDSLIDPSIYLSVRTPQHLRTIFEAADVWNKTINDNIPFRWGLYNDGLLGSELDLGTYGPIDYSFDEINYRNKGNRAQELEFQNKLCLLVPNGGEAVLDNEYNDIDNACKDMSVIHISYLNQLHDLSVINKWKNQQYSGSGIYNKMSGYDYVTRHLGYRYVIRSSNLDYTPFSKKGATINIVVDNVGFAPAYKDFTVTATIVNTATGIASQYDLSNDYPTSSWEYTSNNISFTISNDLLESGEYDVYFSVYDKANDEFIKFAIDNNISADYGYLIGSFSVSK